MKLFNTNKIKLLLVLSLSFISLFLPGQNQTNIKFTHILIEQGLSQSVVFDILQDNDGLMWFGTQDGLNKYDGYKFTIYQNEPKDVISVKKNKSLSNNSVRCIFEDKSGVLWIGTENGGLNKYDKCTGTFTVYSYDSKNPNSISSDEIRTVFEDASGTLWIGTNGEGLNKFDKKTEKFTKYKHNPYNPQSLSNNIINTIIEDKTGTLWIGTYGGGINILDKKTGKFKKIVNDPNDPKSLSNNNILRMIEDKKGNIWIGTEGGGLNKFDIKTGKFTVYKNKPNDPQSLSNNIIWAILEDKQGELWIGTYGGGLNKYDQQTDKFIIYKNDPYDIQLHSDNYILSLYQDISGTIWIGTYGDGLNKFDKNTGKFTVYKQRPSPNMGINDRSPYLSSSAIRSMMIDKSGILWVGTRGGGLNMYDKVKGEFLVFKNDPDDQNSISSNAVYAILEDKEGNLWIGTFGGGLNKLDQRLKKFISYKNNPKNPKSLSNNNIRTMIEDKSGNIWIGTDGGGLNKFDKKNGEFIVYKNNPNDNNANSCKLQSLSNNAVYSIYEATDGTIWVGTDCGLNKYDTNTGKFRVYKTDPFNISSISNNTVYAITEDKNGGIWIGTAGGGINKLITISNNSPLRFLIKWNNHLNTEKEIIKFKEYTIYDGLPNNCIYSIIIDHSENLWLATNKGLCKFTPPSNIDNNKINSCLPSIRNYDTYDGLPSNEFNLGSFFKSQNGTLYFGSINGLIAFNPDSIKDDETKPPVIITNLTLFNKDVSILPAEYKNLKDTVHGKLVHINGGNFIPQSITYSKELTLSYVDKVFTFEFAALHYSVPEKNHYAYMMEGFDKDWNYIGTRRYASYTNLSPGTYTFRVKAANCDGIWNEEGTSIKITILPPFWQTWWFRTAIILTSFCLVVFYIKWRESKLRQDKLILENTVKERTEQLSEANEELNLQNEEISAQRDFLKGFNTELQLKNEEIKTQRDEIELQRDKIQEQKTLIEQKNINITASITYAKRIQSAILPPQELIDKYIPDSFILYKPKSIVSGDFYWLENRDQFIYIAVVDCTGHGVPGALMSIVGYNLLSQALNEKHLERPSEIINFLAKTLSLTLRQYDTDTSIRDGMDLIICRIDKSSLLMDFAGTHCPLYHFRDGDLTEYKTENYSIGFPFNEKFTEFSSQQLKLKKGDLIYIFTDGYIDQFGGPEGKKIMSKNFKKLILQIAKNSMKEQINTLDEYIESWMTNFGTEYEQTDDMTVMGVRI